MNDELYYLMKDVLHRVRSRIVVSADDRVRDRVGDRVWFRVAERALYCLGDRAHSRTFRKING